jgi:acyl-phosphate glycerol 3-phosphate acyltransferase
MDIVATVLLALAGFILGAVPFSVIIGHLALGKNIRDYGDGNPGSVNVFRAGGSVKVGLLAVVLDIVKGFPFVFLASAWLHLPDPSIVIVAMCAILGHAFSPFLRWHGGKAVAISFGALLGLPQHEALLAFIALMVVGFCLVENDSWIPVLGAAGTLAYLAVTDGPSWYSLLVLCILVLFVFKQFNDLRSLPRLHGRLIRWVEGKLRGSTPV